ncbi:hypothetical protein VIGAN_08071300 [Vigna angularis var. angularis]|uniref:Uncharacterized protein n=1 Tax=Vigna angularis var. angularis TaxID=157739 RepID=A0A0S3SMR7_PHAAN|nr:hypothetical protein VIGAN_08071300 [Vigna angularis var. angularis]
MVEDEEQFEAFEEEELEESIYNNIPEMYSKGANRSKPRLLKTADIRIKTNFSMELLSLDEFQLPFLLRPWWNRGDDDERAAPLRQV